MDAEDAARIEGEPLQGAVVAVDIETRHGAVFLRVSAGADVLGKSARQGVGGGSVRPFHETGIEAGAVRHVEDAVRIALEIDALGCVERQAGEICPTGLGPHRQKVRVGIDGAVDELISPESVRDIDQDRRVCGRRPASECAPGVQGRVLKDFGMEAVEDLADLLARLLRDAAPKLLLRTRIQREGQSRQG